jgi:hypothetical protein
MTVLSLLGCANQSTNAASSSNDNRSVATVPSSPTVTAATPPTAISQPTTDPSPSLRVADQVADQGKSEPRAVVDQFYQAYVLEKTPWQQLQEYLDPDTYQQLSQFKAYDSDPFAATQERVYEYSIDGSRITGNTAEVDIRFKTGGRAPSPDFGRSITVVLQNNDGQWQIKNMIYGTDTAGQPNDLLHSWVEDQKALVINQK